ncbi:hypothetical protein AXF42_Ash006572 [Apostasia shenzhenica]|uniref:CRIB domain-containing protein n=1 Tax=Apostasia shenzhenica TaxID=1088818 RepID=A0A2I0AZH3_9ASPA|nr:hypothetical protein AXF42_Ash006572 [Apostasia shenzhenica]
MLPFSIGCVSQSSITVVENPLNKAQSEPTSTHGDGQIVKEQIQSSEGTKSISGFLQLSKTGPITSGFHRLVKGFKSLSSLFTIYKEEDEEEEAEMEIGYPTDVQHVAHIGWDGFNNLSSIKNLEKEVPEFFPLPSLTMKRFELAMASQANTMYHITELLLTH